ncbi:MAG: flagellin [Candidatus Methanophagaceae archaeon]|nr:MAG: flagellin [Methanophagales archaeon]
MAKRSSLRKDERAFTGLEAAIVLTAFVVVAAVFSYVVLNAGFFTTQTAKSTVHTGVTQATSSVELAGDVIGYGNTAESKLDNVTFYLRLTAGKNPVNINKTIVTFTTSEKHIVLTKNYTAHDNSLTSISENEWTFSWIDPLESPADNLLEKCEKVCIKADIPDLDPNTDFTIEVKPPEGSTLGIDRSVPPAIYEVMNLK